MRITLKYMSALLALLFILSMGGVFAIWQYAKAPADAKSKGISVELHEFVWKPEQILPTEQPGENYMDLLGSVLENSKAGLNSSKGVLEKAVISDKIVHSTQNVQGGNLKHLFITSESKKLDFIVQYVTATEFHLYMYEDADVTAGLADVTNILVYKTILIKENGEWIGQETKQGYAPVTYLGEYDSYKAIDPERWAQGALPQQ